MMNRVRLLQQQKACVTFGARLERLLIADLVQRTVDWLLNGDCSPFMMLIILCVSK